MGLAYSAIAGAGTELDFSHKQLLQILSLELPEIRLLDWDKGNNILNFSHENETITMSLYGPMVYDLNQDGKNDVILVAGQFDKWGTWEFEGEDFLAIYTLGENVPPAPLLSKRFPQTDKGEFTDIKVEDITGDGFPEIWVKYNFATAGARRWNWKEFLYIIQGKEMFNTLLEVQTREGKGSVKGDEYLMETEVRIEDLDDDGINEIIVTQYTGKDEGSLRKSTDKPMIYYFNGERYRIKLEND